MKYFTKKQVRAFNRRLKHIGEGPLKPSQCRKVNNRNAIICRDKKGYYTLTSPHARDRAPGQRKSR